MKSTRTQRHGFIAGLLSLTLAACGGGSDSVTAPTATLNLSLTDAPVDGAQKVWIQFTGVEAPLLLTHWLRA